LVQQNNLNVERIDAIVGDLDSVGRDILNRCVEEGIKILDLSYDQDTTDLQKCLTFIREEHIKDDKKARTVVALGGLGGRLDHTLSNLSTLYMFRDMDVVLIGEGNAARLIRAGEETAITVDTVEEGPNCAVVPLNGPAKVTTSGLKWNLSDTLTEFGGLISTSNEFADSQVSILSDKDVLWITEVPR